MYTLEIIEQVLRAYCYGISVEAIADLTGLDPETVNEIIDTYSDLFLEG